MKLRAATVEDALAISEIRVAAWRAAYKEFMPSDFLDALDPKQGLSNWQERLGHAPAGWCATVAEQDEKVVGFAIVGLPRYQTSADLELWALNVHPFCWRCGIGRMLTHHAVEIARLMGSKAIELWCLRGNIAAQTTYEGCGFYVTEHVRSSSQLIGHPLHEVLYAKAL